MTSLGLCSSPTGGRFAYRTSNETAILCLIVAIVLIFINCFFFLVIWVLLLVVATMQKVYEVDFNDKNGTLDIKCVGAITNSIQNERSIPYSQINNATVLNGIVMLQLTTGESVPVSEHESSNIAEERCRLLNTHLFAANSMEPCSQTQQVSYFPVTTSSKSFTASLPYKAQQQVFYIPQDNKCHIYHNNNISTYGGYYFQ
jgi:hypothetical protein